MGENLGKVNSQRLRAAMGDGLIIKWDQKGSKGVRIKILPFTYAQGVGWSRRCCSCYQFLSPTLSQFSVSGPETLWSVPTRGSGACVQVRLGKLATAPWLGAQSDMLHSSSWAFRAHAAPVQQASWPSCGCWPKAALATASFLFSTFCTCICRYNIR